MNSLISFVESSRSFTRAISNAHLIYLLDSSNDFNVFDYLPKLFTITTKNKSALFNTDMLKESSSVIKNYLSDNPNILFYHLDIDDENSVLTKFEHLYQGKLVYFTKDDYQSSQQIIKLLNIQNFPICLEKHRNRSIFSSCVYEDKIKEGKILINKSEFIKFLRQKLPQTFSIRTKKKEYKCNRIGIFSSPVISKLISKDSNLDQFYYDYDDEFDEFQSICDFFNFKKVDITENNMNSIKKISEDLQIEKVHEKVLKYIQKNENLLNIIEKQRDTIKSIDNLFDLLCNINEKSIEFVKTDIIESFWLKSEENIQELAAFIIQIIKTDISLHKPIIDLLVELNKEADETNYIKILIPFISKRLLNSFDKHLSFCSFVYNLHKRGFISKNELLNQLRFFFLNYNIDGSGYGHSEKSSKYLNYVYMWFWPEIIEINFFDLNREEIEKNVSDFIQFFMQNNDIESYKSLRDSEEPNDQITKVIRCDDVDALQLIISSKNINIIDALIPFNLFEKFVINGKTNLLNYAALHGSIKCFKYLLLNHNEIDENSLQFAIYGKNIEIIKIVDQKISSSYNFYIENQKEEITKQIVASIKTHQNDLFDWIFEKTFLNMDNESLLYIIKSSAKNGNIHSIIEIFNKKLYNNYYSALYKAWDNGFYRFSKIIVRIMDEFKRNETSIFDDFSYHSTMFDNLSIFKLYQQINPEEISNCLYYAIKYDSMNIIKYFFEVLIKKGFEITEKVISISLNSASKKLTSDMFKYLMNQFRNLSPQILQKFKCPVYFLIDAIEYENIEVIKIFYEMLIQQNDNINLTNAFKTALLSKNKKIYQYFIDQKIKICFDELLDSIHELVYIDPGTFSAIYEFSPHHYKTTLLNLFIHPAIEICNKKLIEFIFEKQIPCNNELIEAVIKKDIEICELILKYNSSPSYINKINRYKGSALSNALYSNNINIFKLILSLPGIDTDTFCYDRSELINSVSRLNIDALNLLFDAFSKDKSLAKKRSCEYFLERTFDDFYFDLEIDPKVITVINRILDIFDIDVRVYILKYKLFERIIHDNKIDLLKKLAKVNKIDFNFYDESDNKSLLAEAIKNNLDEIAEFLINLPQVNINQTVDYSETPLSIAVRKNKEKIVNLLINNVRFKPEENSISYCILNAKSKISKILLNSEYFDVNDTTYDDIDLERPKYSSNYEYKILYHTLLMSATDKNDIAKVDLIIHHPKFDKNKSFYRTAIFISICKNFVEIFSKLLELEENINNYEYRNESLLSLAVKYNKTEIIKIILQNEKFDSKKNSFLRCFLDTFNVRNESYEMMKIFIDYDKKHDNLIDFNNLLPDGKSFFTSIRDNTLHNPNIENVVNLLLKNGADPNLKDKNSVYPLQYAFEQRNKSFILGLLNSNRIDLKNQLIDCSYLHLAASYDQDIFKEFLNKNIFDINSENKFGMTPLMIACKYGKRENVEILFKFDNLDYLHRDKNGKDALKIVFGSDISPITDRDAYFQKLKEGLH